MHNCMDHRPDVASAQTYVCPVCGKRWYKAQVWPGAYWESEEERKAEEAETKRFLDRLKLNEPQQD